MRPNRVRLGRLEVCVPTCSNCDSATRNGSDAHGFAVQLGKVGSGRKQSKDSWPNTPHPPAGARDFPHAGTVLPGPLRLLLAGFPRSNVPRRSGNVPPGTGDGRSNAYDTPRRELRRARDELRDQLPGPRPDRGRPFWEADLEGSDLAGMTIASDSNGVPEGLLSVIAASQARPWRWRLLLPNSLVSTPRSWPRARLKGGLAARSRCRRSSGPTSRARPSPEGRFFSKRVIPEGDPEPTRSCRGASRASTSAAPGLEAALSLRIARDDWPVAISRRPPTYDARTRFPPGFDSGRTLMEAGRVATSSINRQQVKR